MPTDPFGRDSKPAPTKTPTPKRAPDGPYKNVVKQPVQAAKPTPKLATRTAGRGPRGITGLQPSKTASQVVQGIEGFIGNPLKPHTPVLTDSKGGQHPVAGAPLLTPATLALQTAAQAPALIRSAHKQAVDLAHAKQAPSLGGDVNLLLSGALGIPRGGRTDEPIPPSAHPLLRQPPVPKVAEEAAPAPKPVAAAKNVPRSSEEAAQHVAQAAKLAKDRGFGAKPPEPPKVEPGAVTAATGGELGATVRQALKGGLEPGAKDAQTVRASQEAARSVERGIRAGKASEAMKQGGLEGHYAALGQLKGELPKATFGGFQNLDSNTITQMINHAQTHPELRPYEKINTVNAILKAADGKVPTNSEHLLLERAFGKEVADSTVQASTWRDHLGRNAAEVLNLPRALQSSFDLSAPFRQGLVAGVSHPVLFSRNIVPMVKAFGSERVYNGIIENIHNDPLFPLADKAKLALTDVHSHALVDREEAYMSSLVGKVPLLRGSNRAYTGFLVKTRMDVFKHLVQQAAEQGRNINDPKLLKDIAKFVNASTGRGTIGKLEPAAVVLNSVLFSPRLLASRLNFLNPVWYARLDPFARRQALKAAAGLVLTMGTVLEMSRLAGATVNTDPTNADFGKMKFGKTRVDIAAGFQQPIRLLAEEASGHITSSTTGKTLTLGPGGPGKLSRWDILERFGISKLGPLPSATSDVLHGQTFIGDPVTFKGEATSHLTPMLWQDLYDLYNNGGVPAVAKGVVPGMFGVGLQTYGPKKSVPVSSDPFGRAGTSKKAPADAFGRSGAPASGKSSDPFGR